MALSHSSHIIISDFLRYSSRNFAFFLRVLKAFSLRSYLARVFAHCLSVSSGFLSGTVGILVGAASDWIDPITIASPLGLFPA